MNDVIADSDDSDLDTRIHLKSDVISVDDSDDSDGEIDFKKSPTKFFNKKQNESTSDSSSDSDSDERESPGSYLALSK